MRHGSLAFVVAVCLAGGVSVIAAQQQPPTPEEMAAGMKRWEESCRPGPAHKVLEQMIGKWDVTFRVFYTGGPGGTATETKGTAVNTWYADGRWLQSDVTGDMMGKAFKGLTLLGYDNFKKKYVSVSVDDATTAMTTREGFADRTGKTLILYGPMDEPITGENDKTVKYVHRLLGPDKMTLEVHDLAIGETDTLVIEMVYTRAK